ncbi:MAG: AMP-binding protein [Candidatus Heimdallarchaeota archaeon]|nr:MAG: AMP-binding protein [Candidatus Heimdallarchaeota archaeon]
MVTQFDYLSKRVVYSPDAEAIVDVEANKSYTYRMFNERANRVANFLQDLNFNKGDRICVIAHNTLEYWEAFFGSQKCGGILAGLNWRLVPRELASLVKDLSPRVLIYDRDFAKAALEIQREVSVDNWIALSPEGVGPETSVIYEEGISKSSPDPPRRVKLSYNDPMGIVFTGGTTGLPKGAMITYQHVAFNTLNTIRDILPGDTYINHLPLFHVGGLYVYPLPLFILGGKVLQMKAWDPEKVLKLITEKKPNFFFAVPTQHRMLMNHPLFMATDFSSVRFLTSGGEPLPIDIIQKFKGVHGVRFKQGFGMTEVGPGCFALDPWDAERKIGSIGTPNFFIDAKIVEPETGRECEVNEIGELLFKGPTVTVGYWNRPELNEKLLDEDGWFRTGDLVRVDEEGYYYVIDRTKDMFISGGENVYPREIENILEEHPLIDQIQIIGVPHHKWGETGRAIIVLNDNAVLTEDEVIDFCQGKLAKFKLPKSVVFIDSFIPYTSGVGKILKRSLKEKYGYPEK